MTTTGSDDGGLGRRVLVGVGVVLTDDRGRLLLIQRGREPGKGLWAVPGGKVEWGEQMREAARREVEEETGLEVQVGEVVWVGEVIEDEHHIVLIDFAGRVTGGELVASDDADAVMWVAIDEAAKMPLTTTMHDLVNSLPR